VTYGYRSTSSAVEDEELDAALLFAYFDIEKDAWYGTSLKLFLKKHRGGLRVFRSGPTMNWLSFFLVFLWFAGNKGWTEKGKTK
jgi:hypothetical protein